MFGLQLQSKSLLQGATLNIRLLGVTCSTHGGKRHSLQKVSVEHVQFPHWCGPIPTAAVELLPPVYRRDDLAQLLITALLPDGYPVA
jgi:hypothetical protein